jgi:hypothetical protein
VSAPAHAISNYGSIKASSIGRFKGKSIAIAFDRGFYILDLSCRNEKIEQKKSLSCDAESRLHTYLSTDYGVHRDANEMLNTKNRRPKWRCYGNSQDEKSVSIICMSWWERVTQDLLIAVVTYDRNRHGTDRPFLACWSSKRIGVDDQLMRGDAMESLGIPIPSHISPMMMSVLSEPLSHSIDFRRQSETVDRAVILLSEIREEGLVYVVYHLQATDSSMNGNDRPIIRLQVAARLHLHGVIQFSPHSDPISSSVDGSFYSVFVSGASFAFHLVPNGGT